MTESDNNSSSVYTVDKGDTLSRIAQRELGDAGRWSEIARLNQLGNPNLILIGQQLTLPVRTYKSEVGPIFVRPTQAYKPEQVSATTTSSGSTERISPRTTAELPRQDSNGQKPAIHTLARGLMYVIFEQLPDVGATTKVIRKVAVVPRNYAVVPKTNIAVPVPGVGPILPADPNGVLTPIEHLMAEAPERSQFLSASDKAFGAPIGATIFGAAGYFGADWLADYISPN